MGTIIFQEHPINMHAVVHRRLICEHGINDAPYLVRSPKTGEGVCPYYSTWRGMLTRCYSRKVHKKHPTYADCSVSEDWLLFSNFKAWMCTQDWVNNQLDKDIIQPGNKIYSADTCCFISPQINTLLTNCDAAMGFIYRKERKKFRAVMNIKGKRQYLGSFSTAKEATTAYKIAKKAHILNFAKEQTDPRVTQGLLLYANAL